MCIVCEGERVTTTCGGCVMVCGEHVQCVEHVCSVWCVMVF